MERDLLPPKYLVNLGEENKQQLMLKVWGGDLWKEGDENSFHASHLGTVRSLKG